MIPRDGTLRVVKEGEIMGGSAWSEDYVTIINPVYNKSLIAIVSHLIPTSICAHVHVMLRERLVEELLTRSKYRGIAIFLPSALSVYLSILQKWS